MKIIKKQILALSIITLNFIIPLFLFGDITNYESKINQPIIQENNLKGLESAYTNPSGYGGYEIEDEDGYDYNIRSFYEGANVILDETPDEITPPDDTIQTYSVPLSTSSYGLWPASMGYEDVAVTKNGQLWTYNPFLISIPERDIAINPVWNYPSVLENYRSLNTAWLRLTYGDMTGTSNWEGGFPNIPIPYYEPSIDYIWNPSIFTPEQSFSPRRTEYQEALISYNDDRFITFFSYGSSNDWDGIEIEFSYNLPNLNFLREQMHFYVWMRALKKEEDVTWGWLFGNEEFDIPLRYKIIEYVDDDGYTKTNGDYRYLTIPKGRQYNELNIPPEERWQEIDRLPYMSEWQRIDLAPLISDINLIGQHNIRIQLEINAFGASGVQKNMLFDVNGIEWDLQFQDGFSSEANWRMRFSDLYPDTDTLSEVLISPEWQFDSVDINIDAQAGSGIGTDDYLRYGQFYVYNKNHAYQSIETGTFSYTEFNEFLFHSDEGGYDSIFLQFKGSGSSPEFLTDDSATITIQDISFTFHWHIQHKAESSYFYDPDNADKILWKVELTIADQGFYSPISNQLYLPPNYEMLEIRKLSDDTIVSSGFTYDEPSSYWWDTVQRKLEITLTESLYGWFESENLILYNTNYAMLDQIPYHSEYYMDNMPITIEFIFDARYLTLDDIYEYSIDYFGEGGTAGLTSEEILDIIAENEVIWGVDVFDWWDEWYLTGYSWDYFESSPYSIDYNTFFDSSFSYVASIGEIDVSNKINQFEDSITLITTPQINAQFYETEAYSELLFKDSITPRQVGYSNVDSLFKTDYCQFEFDEDYTYNATHFNFTGSYKGSSFENRDQTVLVSLFDSNLDYTGASFTYIIDDYIYGNLKVDNLISTYGLSMKPTNTIVPIKIDFTNEDPTEIKAWIRVAVEPAQGDESHAYYTGQLFQLVTIAGSSSTQVTFNLNMRDATMPRLYGAYNYIIQQYEYIDDDSYGDLQNTIENQSHYVCISDTAGEVLEQWSWTSTGDQDFHDFLIQVKKAGNEDGTKLIASFIDTERICIEQEISMQYPESNSPYIQQLYRPSTSEITTIGALQLSARITDRNDDIDNVNWRLSFWLNIKYKGDDNLDPDNDQLFETDWEIADEISPNIWGVDWDISVYEDQVAEEFYQIIPTSEQFWIEFDVNDTLLNNDYKSYKFSNNPYVEIDAVQGNFDLNKFELPNMWVFRSFANYTYQSANVEANDELTGTLNIHSSILYVPTRFIINMPDEWTDVHDYQTPFRYNYKGQYWNRTEASYAQYQSLTTDGYSSKWDFKEYYNVMVVSYSYNSPSMTTLSYRTLTNEKQQTQYEYIIQISSRHDFENITAKVSGFFGTQTYSADLFIRTSGNYELVDKDLYQLNYFQSMSPEISWVIPEMQTDDTFLFKVLITLNMAQVASTEHLIYGAVSALMGIVAWLVFSNVGSNTLRNRLSPLGQGNTKYILVSIGIAVGVFVLVSTIFWFVL